MSRNSSHVYSAKVMSLYQISMQISSIQSFHLATAFDFSKYFLLKLFLLCPVVCVCESFRSAPAVCRGILQLRRHYRSKDDANGVRINRNPIDALQCLHLASHSRIIWADAPCIDQNDVVEDGAQVQQMNLIFK